MYRALFAVCLLGTPVWAGSGHQALLERSLVELRSAGFQAPDQDLGAVPGLIASAKAVPVAAESATKEDLLAAQAALERLVAELDKMAAAETDEVRQLRLQVRRGEAAEALQRVKSALQKLDADGPVRQLLDQALFLQKLIGAYLGEADFAGTVHLRRGTVEIAVEGGAAYEALRRKFPFLGVAVGGVVRINTGAQLVSQFNALKAEFYGTLLNAAGQAKDKGVQDTVLGLAEWGRDTKVIYPGQDWMKAVPLVTQPEAFRLRQMMGR